VGGKKAVSTGGKNEIAAGRWNARGPQAEGRSPIGRPSSEGIRKESLQSEKMVKR